MTRLLGRSLARACLLGSLALLLHRAHVAGVLSLGATRDAFDAVATRDLSGGEGSMIRLAVARDAAQCASVTACALGLCGLAAWLASGARRLRPLASAGLGILALSLCLWDVPTVMARMHAWLSGTPWRDLSVGTMTGFRPVEYMMGPVAVVTYEAGFMLSAAVDALPYALPVPAIALMALAVPRIRRAAIGEGDEA